MGGVIIFGNNIMVEPDIKQASLWSRIKYQLNQIEYSCRQVTAMARHLNTLASDIAASDINTRKVEILKTDIKDKLKQYASSMDSIYQILDRKIQLILAQMKRTDGKKIQFPAIPMCKKCHSLDSTITKEAEKQKNMSIDNQFSQTLNPRIARLQARIQEYQTNEVKLKSKIAELQVKNESLLDQFNRLSTASNKKINELNSKIQRESQRDHDSISLTPGKQIVTSNTSAQFTPNKQKKTNPLNYGTEQMIYNLSNEATSLYNSFQREEKTKLLNFGCIPSKPAKGNGSLLGVQNVNEDEGLDRDDRNRRFDLLLNKLRDCQQEGSTESSHPNDELRRGFEPVASVQPIRRYQI